MSSYKYTEEMVKKMEDVFTSDGVNEASIESLVKEFEFPARSIRAKARKLGYDVPTVQTGPVFSEEETAAFRAFVTQSNGTRTAEEISKEFAGGKFNPRQVSGKALALELTSYIKPAEKKVTPKSFSEDEEATIRQMVESNASLEAISERLGKPLNSVRGKLLSMGLKAVQTVKKATKTDAYEGLDKLAPTMTVAQLKKHYTEVTGVEKSERGVKTVLTRRRIACADYTSKVKE